jgi:hypothetical protein
MKECGWWKSEREEVACLFMLGKSRPTASHRLPA